MSSTFRRIAPPKHDDDIWKDEAITSEATSQWPRQGSFPPSSPPFASLTSRPAPSSYYDRRLRQGPALIRARKPYLVKNAVLGLGLWTLVGGVCTSPSTRLYDRLTNLADWYTLKAVGQDEFEDVKVPDAPRQSQQSN
jgi:cytochrome c oxidase assembly factor 3, fungi type